MSAPEQVGQLALRLSTPSAGRRWVWHAATGRTLGSVTRQGSRWTWQASTSAFRGDGRPASACDGDPTDRVPAHLLGEAETTGTRNTACAALVAWLDDHHAPVLGYGPHTDVAAREVA